MANIGGGSQPSSPFKSELQVKSKSQKCASNEDLMRRAKNTISAASRMLRRKIPQSGHLMMSKRFWMQSVPSQGVDVVITFPPDSAESTILWFKQRIEKIPGIVLHTKSITISKGTKTRPNCYAFHLAATYQCYLRGLELLQVPKPLKEDVGGGTKEFNLKEASSFRGIENMDDFLTSQERQAIILHLLHTVRAERGDSVGKLKFREGEAIIARSVTRKVVYQVFPIHEPAKLQKLQSTWVRNVLERQPIGDIREYFGVQIALYFAWLGHYTTALCIPAIVGIFFWFFFCGREEFLEDIGFVTFGFFNVIWATLYLESWKRRSAELAYTWGTADQRDELLVEPRPQFKGEERLSEITGKPELFYPEWKRNAFRYCVTVPVIIVCLLVVFVSVFLILELQQWWDGVIKSRGYFDFLSYLPKILLAIVIPTLDSIYSNIAVWLNDKENYRNATRYENNMVVKKALFQFVNSFLALFYIAFYLQDMDKLKELLAALLITRQVMGNVKESLIPYAKKQMKLAKLSFDLYGALSPTKENGSDATFPENPDKADAEHKKNDDDSAADSPSIKSRKLSQVELEASAAPYDGTFEDYLEMFIQFGYVTLFSSAYPLAGLCALLNNLIEIRGDAFKLCFVHKRPFGQRVNSIGSWQTAMELMGGVGVIVNCALIGLSGQVNRMFPNITATQTILLIIILEHVMLLLKVWISYAIPDIPSWVAKEMAKIEWKRREAEKITSSFSFSTANTISIDTEDKAAQTELEPASATDHKTMSQMESRKSAEDKRKASLESASQSSLELEAFKAAVNRSSGDVFHRPQTEAIQRPPPVTNATNNSLQNRSHSLHVPGGTEENLVAMRKSSCPQQPTEHKKKNQHVPKMVSDQRRLLCQRMASDTDLWLSLKAAQAKYQSSLEATKESTTGSRDMLEVTSSTDDNQLPAHIVVNRVDMPDLPETGPRTTDGTGGRSSVKKCPTPSHKRVLNQDEFDRRLKAKRALFSGKGRSLSLASFRLPGSSAAKKVVMMPIEKLSHSHKNSAGHGHSDEKYKADEKYLQENRAQGELEILGLESLINVNDVGRKTSK